LKLALQSLVLLLPFGLKLLTEVTLNFATFLHIARFKLVLRIGIKSQA
jgi:hypothetical protein